MNYIEALKEIKQGNIRPIYLLYGEETYLTCQLKKAIIDKLLPKIDQITNLIRYDSDPSLGELTSLLETYPFFSKRNVVVIQETQLFKENKKNAEDDIKEYSVRPVEQRKDLAVERLLSLLENMPEYSNVIFTVTCKKVKQGYKEISKRSKIFKVVEKHGATIEMMPISVKEARPWIASKLAELDKKAAPNAIEYILEVLSMMPQISMSFLENELIKMALYSKDNKEITRKQVSEILSAVPEVSIFAMLEALSEKRLLTAVELLKTQLAEGDNPLRILAMLSRQMRMLWQAKIADEKGLGGKYIAEAFSLPPFIGDKIMRQSSRFPEKKLRLAMIELAEIDYGLKSGQADSNALLQFVIELVS